MPNVIHDGQWSKLSEYIAERIGLHFPRERWTDLERGFAGAAQEFGFEETGECLDWLLSAPPTQSQLHVLATHLTIGETYFFRDPHTIRALAERILPELIRARQGGDQRLRLWSAACCTGEEPYTLAILLHQALGDFSDWRVTITATDLNPRFLQTAAEGVYRDWSFRNAPVWLKERYFTRTKDGRYAIIPEIRECVTFAHLNLVEDAYPSVVTDTTAMDLILCRNVLMYFTPAQIRRVIVKLHHSLLEDGWLVVSPSEASRTLFPEFAVVHVSGSILFRKVAGPGHDEPTPAWSEPLPDPVAVEATVAPPEPSSDAVLATTATGAEESAAHAALARTLANEGRLAEALERCDSWIAVDKLDPAAHYLRAVVLLERGNPVEAHASLRRSIYLNPSFVLAHCALGSLARSSGRTRDAERHFAHALQRLRRHRPDDPLPESEGLTAGQLIESITAMSGNRS